jgi:hypothetical protein
MRRQLGLRTAFTTTILLYSRWPRPRMRSADFLMRIGPSLAAHLPHSVLALQQASAFCGP